MIRRIALICLSTGALLLSFVAYQLWGTALYEHHAQNVLGLELRNDLGVKPNAGSKPQSAQTPPSSTSQTLTSKVAPTIAAPPAGQPIGFMTIPRLGMTNDAIVEGAGEAQLQEGPGHYTGTSLPGEAGNAAIAGHRTTYAHPFYNLNLMQPGDFIYITTAQGLFDYEVTSGPTVVPPTDVTVLDASTVPELTLTTCNPRYSATSRLVVVAMLQDAFTASSFGSTSTPTAPTTTTKKPGASLPETLAGDGGVSGVGTAGQVRLGLLWGALTAAVGWLAIIGWRRLERRQLAWVVLAIGVPVTVALLLVCFQHVSLALPETF